MAGKTVDLFMVYQFLRRLTTPFDETEAYKLGIIDDKGNKVRDPKTREEKKAYGVFDRLVFNIKKLLGKVPGGRSRLASYAAALWLIKEQDENGRPTVRPDDTDLIYEGVMSEMKSLMENNYAQYNMLKEELMKNEEAPANAVGTGNVAGAAPGEDPPGKLPLKHKKDKKAKKTYRKIKSFKKFEDENLKEFHVRKPNIRDTLGITRDKMPQIKSRYYDEFYNYLKDHGAKLEYTRVPANQLKAIQSEFDDEKIAQSMMRTLSNESEKPLVASRDYYIIDGHHRWLAAWNKNPETPVKIVRVKNMDIQELLDLTIKFPRTTFKKLKESLEGRKNEKL